MSDDMRARAGRVAAEVAAALGEGWSVATDRVTVGADIAHTDGRALFIRELWNAKGRWTIAGIYPESPASDRFAGDGKPMPRITVAATRTPAAIAREITRRLLPAYETRLADVRAHIVRATDDAAERERVAALLCAALPGTRPVAQHSGTRIQLSLPSLPASMYGTGEVNYSGTVELHLRSMPVAVAVAVLEAVARFNDDEPVQP